jgi:glycosyltransferase involved in cell wall biosynthesis
VRILFLTYSYLPNVGGVERSVHNLARDLVARGHDVVVATHDGWAVPWRRRPDDVPPTLRLHVPNQTSASPAVAVFRAVMNRLNLAVLLRLCRRRGVEAVHAHHLSLDTVYAARLADRLGLPMILTLRGGEIEEWMEAPGRRAYVVAQLARADRVTAVSASLLAQATALVPSVAARGSVVPNPADPSRLLAAMGPPAPPPARPYIAFAGRLEAMKDVACLVDAYHALAARDLAFPADLVVAGDGRLAGVLRARARDGAGADRIRFAGALPYPDTLRLVAGARALVLPSRASEGCPNVVLEAMALGTPVVVSDLPSLAELVTDGTDGAVFPVGDAAALADRLRAVVGDDALRARLAGAARARLAARHAPDAIVDRYLALYATPPSTSR